MECEKDPFLEMSQDQIEKLNEVLQSEQAKALLRETSGKLFDTTKAGPLASNRVGEDGVVISSSMESLSGLSDLENLELESTVTPHLFSVPNDEEVVNIVSILHEDLTKPFLSEIVLLDHNYSLNSETIFHDKYERTDDPDQDDGSSTLSADSPTPIRRSVRQIEKTERELEKIRTETGVPSTEDLLPKEKLSLRDKINFQMSLPRAEALSSSEQCTKTMKKRSSNMVKNEKLSRGSPSKSPRSSKSRSSDEMSADTKEKFLAGKLKAESAESETESSDEMKSQPQYHRRNQRKSLESGYDSLSDIPIQRQDRGLGNKVKSAEFVPVQVPLMSEKRNLNADESKARKNTIDTALKTAARILTGNNSKGFDLSARKKLNPKNTVKDMKKVRKISDAKDDEVAGYDKKRHSSVGSANQNTPSNLKNVKAKKKTSRSDSINLDLLGPALFSEPDVLVKIRGDDVPDVKGKLSSSDSVECATTSELKPGETKSDTKNVKISDPFILQQASAKLQTFGARDEFLQQDHKIDQLDVSNTAIQTPSKHHSTNSKLSTSTSTNLESRTMDALKSGTELKNVSLLNPNIMRSALYSNLVKSQPNILSESRTFSTNVSMGKSKREQLSEEDDTPTSSKGRKKPIKVEEPVKPERKSQRTIHRKRRIYEDDSDFEESSPKKGCNTKATEIKKTLANSRQKRKQSLKKVESSDDDEDEDEEEDEDVEEEEDEEQEEEEEEEKDESDAEEGAAQGEAEWSSEDDPERLWCICRQPHNNKFMICCDACEDWFHGTCVGITRNQGRMLEKQNKDWFCPSCKKQRETRGPHATPSSAQSKVQAAKVKRHLR